jgi:hypothetical protein
MSMNPFKKTTAPSVAPARAAFNAQRRAHAEKEQERRTAIEEAGRMQGHLATRAAVAGKVASLRAAIDESVAATFLSNAEPPADLEERKRELAEQEHELQTWAPIARGAEIAHRRFAATVADRTREVQELAKPIQRLAHPVFADDELVALAAEFREREEAFRDVYRRVFVIATAADKLAMALRLGEFRGSEAYSELHISRPTHTAYVRGTTDPGTADREHWADLRALDAEADKLINDLLNSEAAEE